MSELSFPSQLQPSHTAGGTGGAPMTQHTHTNPHRNMSISSIKWKACTETHTYCKKNYISYTLHTPAGHRQLSNCYNSPLKHCRALPKLDSFCLQTCGTVICDWKHPTEQQEKGKTFTFPPVLPSRRHIVMLAVFCPPTAYFITLPTSLSFQ